MKRIFKSITIKHPIGWVDESCPEGGGYRIMSEVGIKHYDMEERNAYLLEKERVKNWLHYISIKE